MVLFDIAINLFNRDQSQDSRDHYYNICLSNFFKQHILLNSPRSWNKSNLFCFGLRPSAIHYVSMFQRPSFSESPSPSLHLSEFPASSGNIGSSVMFSYVQLT